MVNRAIIILGLCTLLSFAFQSRAQFPEGIKLSTLPEKNEINQQIDNIEKSRESAVWKINALHSTLSNSVSIGYSEGIRKSLYQLMVFTYSSRMFRIAIGYAGLLEQNCSPVLHRQIICEALLIRGISNFELENYVEALSLYQAAFMYAPGRRHRAYALSNMASVLYNLRQYDKAGRYQDLAVETDSLLIEEHGHLHWYKKAELARHTGNLQKAREYFKKAYNSAKTTEDRANVMFRRIIFLSQEGWGQEAVTEFQAFIPRIDGLSSKSKGLIWLAGGSAYYSTKNYQKALYYLRQAQGLQQAFGKPEQRVLMHKLSDVYYAIGKFKQAYDLHKRVHRLEDSAKSTDVIHRVNELETLYRTAQKDIALAEQKVLTSKSNELLYKSRLASLLIVISLGVLLLLIWVRYYYLKQKNEKLKSVQALSRLEAQIEGEERERTRLSQELHDGVNSSLAATASFIQMMAYQTPGLSGSAPYAKVQELLASTSMEIRAIAHNLAPHILIQNGLLYAIEEFSHNLFQERVRLSIESSGSESVLPERLKLFIYRITQELLHNIHKHARATIVAIHLDMEAVACQLQVEDNGIGIDSEERKNGIGLQNIREKVRAYGGTIQIKSVSPTGTRIGVRIPIT